MSYCAERRRFGWRAPHSQAGQTMRLVATSLALVVALVGAATPLFAAAGSTQRVGPIDRDEMTPEERRLWFGITAAEPGDDEIDAGFQMFSTSAASTGEKPQSKLWYHDGSYWGILRGPDGVAFYEKQGSTWVRGTVITSSGHADVKWTGTHLFVLIYASTSRVYEYTYDAGARSWVLASGFPVTVPNPSGSETMVLESDSSGRLWTCTEGGGNINVYYSTSADRRTWTSSPVVLATGVGSDDICSIVAFGGNKVGVFWSDQNRDEFGFRYHNDADTPTSWSTKENAGSGSGVADDHINLAHDSIGRVFAITKDDNDEMRVHRRNTSGSWTVVTDVVGASATRGVIMLSEAQNRIYILYTRWGVSPERIEYRTADMNTMSFSGTTVFIDSSRDMNNVTDMKQILPSNSLLAVAEDGSTCRYNSFGSPPAGGGGPQPPNAPSNLLATLLAGPQVGLGWTAPSGTIDGYNVYRQVDGGSFTQLNGNLVTVTSFTDTAPPTGALCYQVRAVAAGLQSNASNSSCVTNNPPPPPPPPGAPANLLATLESGPQVALDWDAPSGTIDGYNVYRQVNGGTFTKLNVALVATSSYLDTAPASGNLCYQVRSQRTGVESAASNTACADNTPPPTAPNPPTNLQASFTDGALLLAMEFDETSGQVINDTSGNANHGRRGSSTGSDSGDGTFTTGIAGGALQFDGNNDWVNIPNAPSLNPTGSFTLEMWARRSGSSGTLISKGASGARTFRLRVTSSGHVEFLWERSDGTDVETEARNAITNTAWHHIACVYDQGAGQNRIYVDGVLRASAAVSGTPATNTSPVLLGAHLSGSSRSGYFTGALDLLRVHPAAVYASNFTPSQSATLPALHAVYSPGEDQVTAQRVDLSWQASSSGTAAAGYNIYRSIDGGPATRINLALVTTTQYSDEALVEGELCYTVTAVSALALESTASNMACVTVTGAEPPPPPPPPQPPGAPANLQATLQSGPEVDLSWSAPSGTIAGYNIYRALDGGTPAKINSTLVAALQYTDSAPVEGELCYTVTAVSSTPLEGPASQPDCVTVDSGEPPPPPPAAPGPPQNPAVILGSTPGGPVAGAAAWSFDEGSGDSFADATGHGHSGQLGSAAGVDTADPVWAPGVEGSGALRFDGSNDRCLVPDATDLRFAGSFTLEAWVKRDVLGVAHCIIAKGDSQRRNYWMLIDSSNRIDFRWETSGGSNRGARSPSSQAITDTNWHHVACVYDQAVSESRIYLDGVLVESESGSGTPVTSTDPVHIGARLSSGSLTNWFRGSLDLVRVAPGVLYSANFTPATSFGGGLPSSVANVSWEPPLTGTAAGYNVYRQIDGGAFTKLNAALITQTSFADTNPPSGQRCYQITAVDALAQEGAASDLACTAPPILGSKLEHEVTPASVIRPRLEVGPNPFNPTTKITFAVPAARHVHIAIYDVRGHRVATLVDAQYPPGTHHVAWHGRDDRGDRVASGTYFVTLDIGATHLRRSLVLLK